MKNRIDGDDSFWDVAHLLPKKAEVPPQKREPAPEIKKSVPAPQGKQDKHAPAASVPPSSKNERDIPLPQISNTPQQVLEYEGQAVFRVEIYPWPNHYSFFSNFRKNALTILKMQAIPAPFVPFFSFMPQYHQLTATQLRFYLHFREELSKERIPKTDFSYLLLLIYEIINLPDKIPPKEGLARLCFLWNAYRVAFPKLDKYLSEWICDYCLIHDLSCLQIPQELRKAGRKNCSFPEFYTGKTGEQGGLLAHCSYSYKTSRFYTEETKALFDKHIPLALQALEAQMIKKNDTRFISKALPPQKTTRTTFDGAVCIYSEKKKLEISYIPQSEHAAHGMITDAVKFCENKVRAACGIRSRFSTPALSGDVRLFLEEYFKEHLPSPKKEREKEIAAYEQKYEPESRGFSEKEAAKIEEQSLFVIERLGAVFEEEESKEQAVKQLFKIEPKPSPALSLPAVPAGKSAEEALMKNAVRALLKKDSHAFSALAKEAGMLPATLCERINEQALELYGDIAIEETEGSFLLLEDYTEELEQWSNS